MTPGLVQLPVAVKDQIRVGQQLTTVSYPPHLLPVLFNSGLWGNIPVPKTASAVTKVVASQPIFAFAVWLVYRLPPQLCFREQNQ